MQVQDADVLGVLNRLATIAESSKESVRATLLARRHERLLEMPDSVRREGPRAMRLMRRVRYDDVRPMLRRCSTPENALWTFLRNVLWTVPSMGRRGRCVKYFVLDENTGGVLGLAEAGSDLQILGPRDSHIGWDKQTKYAGGGLNRVINLGTAVCVQPFGWLCGGKYISEAMATDAVAADWEALYLDPPAAVCTTSIYGRSSQYNRLPHWRYLGDTPGNSPHMAMTLDERRLIQQYMVERGLTARTGLSGKGMGSSFDMLTKMVSHLRFDASAYEGRGQKRGVYWSELYDGATGDLRSGTVRRGSAMRSTADASGWWIDRWYRMRWPKVRDAIDAFDWSQYTWVGAVRTGSDTDDTPPVQGGEAGSAPAPCSARLDPG